MTECDLHDVTYSSKTTEDWDAPQESDFDTDDLGDIADHFLLSESVFPPDDFGDLDLPVVDPDGNLNLNALQAAHGGAHSVESVDDIDDVAAALDIAASTVAEHRRKAEAAMARTAIHSDAGLQPSDSRCHSRQPQPTTQPVPWRIERASAGRRTRTKEAPQAGVLVSEANEGAGDQRSPGGRGAQRVPGVERCEGFLRW